MKIVILDGHAVNPGDLSWDVLNQFGEVTLYQKTESEAEAIERIADHEIVLTNKVPITESLLAACPNIKLVCVQATGYNIVDTAACAKRSALASTSNSSCVQSTSSSAVSMLEILVVSAYPFISYGMLSTLVLSSFR